MVLLFIWVVLYIIWTFLFLCYERWKKRKSDKSVAAILPRKDGLTTNVIGESTFILPVSKPLGATMKPVGATTEKVENQSEKDSTFVPDSDNHPLQVPDEELDGMFDDAPPEGETNDPMDVEVSMDYEEDEEEDTPEQVPSDTIASGISFENMCAAVKVLNQPKGTVSEHGKPDGRFWNCNIPMSCSRLYPANLKKTTVYRNSSACIWIHSVNSRERRKRKQKSGIFPIILG